MKKTMTERIVWIDYAKAIGITLVILAHTQVTPFVTDWISVFRMPLFFFLSGFLFSFDRNPDAKAFVRKRFRQLMIPYVCFNLLTFVFWWFVGRHYGAVDETTLWYEPLVAALFCNAPDMVHNIPLWFLFCLFLLEVVYYFLFRKLGFLQRLIVVMMIGMFGFLNAYLNAHVLPFSLGTMMIGMLFYCAGSELKQLFQSNGLMGLLALIVVTAAALMNERVYLYRNQYGNAMFFLLAAFSGIYMMKVLCEGLSKRFGRCRWVEYMSKNTLTICALHLTNYTLIKGFTVYVLGIPLSVYEGTILPNLLLTVGGILLCIPSIYVLERFLPFVIGRKR